MHKGTHHDPSTGGLRQEDRETEVKLDYTINLKKKKKTEGRREKESGKRDKYTGRLNVTKERLQVTQVLCDNGTFET